MGSSHAARSGGRAGATGGEDVLLTPKRTKFSLLLDVRPEFSGLYIFLRWGNPALVGGSINHDYHLMGHIMEQRIFL